MRGGRNRGWGRWRGGGVEGRGGGEVKEEGSEKQMNK